LRLSMLGPQHDPCLHAKGKESEGLLPFAVHLLETHQYKFRGCGAQNTIRTECLLAAGRSAMDFQHQLNTIRGWPTHAHRQSMLDSIVRFTNMCDAAGVKLIPKNHMMVSGTQTHDCRSKPQNLTPNIQRETIHILCPHSPIDRTMSTETSPDITESKRTGC
jgi:hypothetical protein